MARNAPAKRTPSGRDAAAAKASEKDGDAQSSLERMLGLLDIFTPSAPVRPVTDLVNYLGTSRSTSYRYIKALHEAGLIEAVANGHYVLGPRIVEFDRQIRLADPLYRVGGQVLPSLVELTGHSALLCALYRDSVMCIREHLAEGAPPTLFSRGQRRPLFTAAASKIILPYVPPHRLRRIFEQHQRSIALAGLGTDWQGFRSTLAGIRRKGYVVTYGEFNPGVFGVSAPLFNADELVIGSIGIAGSQERLDSKKLPAFCEAVVAAGKHLSELLSHADADLVRPPRAFGSVTP
ncbi:IclR family transcriptional regulator [Verticiella sediminum]|uniref:IclR family transcriptional regulator n=1 Tax=Verticiella sediminum TaxID=1247510 RepID=A0A556AJG2_9BURK|nr:IclR family transcriptional regulator [Verticiella sediminum]TSH93013.1 IclR family transcriptional regulator [Verticiella sediminum]